MMIANRGGRFASSLLSKKFSFRRHSLLARPIQKVPGACLVREPSCPIQQPLQYLDDDHRYFSTFKRLKDLVLQRPNPVILAVQQSQTEYPYDQENQTENNYKRPYSLPNFALMEPHHLEPAAQQAQAEYEAALKEFESKLSSLSVDQQDSATSELIISFDTVIPELDRIVAPLRCLVRICTLLSHLQQDPFTQNACADASRHVNFHHETSAPIMEALKTIESQLLSLEDESQQQQNDINNMQNKQRLAIVRFLLEGYENRGLLLEDEDREAVESIQSALNELELKYAGPEYGGEGADSTRETLEDMYQILALKAEEAKRLGFSSHADKAFQSMMASNLEEVRSLHEQVASRVLPVVSSETYTSELSREEEIDLRSYLTLDGVLEGMFALSRALFGIVIHEQEEAVNAWDAQVRLFHIFEEETGRYVASFYLDAYRRTLKSNQAFTGQIFDKRGDSTSPLVYMSCNIRPPVWDHLPTEVSFDDALSLFHEFGHCLQFVLTNDEVGGVLGITNTQLDTEELVPQFMEYWLFEEPVLQSLAHLSQAAGEPIPKDAFEQLKRQRSFQKANELMHRIFLAELELLLFSRLDGDESIVTMQRRIAEEYIAHDLFHKRDISPLKQVMESNARGKHVAHYRYMWSEVMSADTFNVFEQHIANEAEVKRLGRLFREYMLSPGASVDMREAFRKFRGRDMATETLLKLYNY